MSVIATGKHSPANASLRARRAESRIRDLTATTQAQETALHAALVRACQDTMLIARLHAENTALREANEHWRHTVIRAKAEQERLRQAVINARPRIREVPTALVRPYSPVVVLPYISPVPYRDTRSDDTQQLPVIDWPSSPAA